MSTSFFTKTIRIRLRLKPAPRRWDFGHIRLTLRISLRRRRGPHRVASAPPSRLGYNRSSDPRSFQRLRCAPGVSAARPHRAVISGAGRKDPRVPSATTIWRPSRRRFAFATELPQRPVTPFGRALHGASADGGAHSGRHAHGPGGHGNRPAARRGGRHQRRPSSRSARSSARKWRAAWMASPSSASWISSPPRSARPKASARCCWPWWRISASSSSSWPTACTTCARWATSAPSGASALPRETIEIYAPIAHRLGMGKVRGELEDLAFQHLEPDAYRGDRAAPSNRRRHSNEEFLNEIRQTVEAELRREGIPARIDGRLKRPYSVFQKLRAPEDHDRPGLRPDGAAHHHRFGEELLRRAGRDPQQVAPHSRPHQGLHRHPAAQSLPVAAHLGGGAARADFRSADPHRGDAPHRRRGHRRALEIQGRRARARRPTTSASPGCATWWNGSATCRIPGEFMSTLKVDLYPEEVYTFTPRGKVIVLPRDATPIDFAYAIHSDVGHTCVGAKVNGRIVPLRSTLRNGDIVEIMTQPGHQPSKDWLALRQDVARAQQDQARHQRQRAAEGHRNRREVSGEGSAPAGRATGQGIEGAAWKAWPANTATARWRTCTPRSATASIPRARCCSKLAPGRWCRRAAETPSACARNRSLARGRPACRAGRGWRCRHQGEGHGRSAGLSRQVLQSDPRRSHRRATSRAARAWPCIPRCAPTCRT